MQGEMQGDKLCRARPVQSGGGAFTPAQAPALASASAMHLSPADGADVKFVEAYEDPFMPLPGSPTKASAPGMSATP
jgi:hypothetical protein